MRQSLFLFLTIFSFIANARHISTEEAKTLAYDFLFHQAESLKEPFSVTLVGQRSRSEADHPYYVFNVDNDNGFIIVSGDDRIKNNVIGYSTSGSFDINNIPPQLTSYLEGFSERIAKPTSYQSQNILTREAEESTIGEAVLLNTPEWGQEYPYNLECPEIDGIQSPCGCAATAMAIIMKYHNWPQYGRNCQQYHDYSNNSIFIDYSKTNFNWSLFDNPVSDKDLHDKEISKIVYAIAVSLMTDFGQYESSARLLSIPQALNYFFKYSDDCQITFRQSYNDDEWLSTLRNEINNNRPIIYSAKNFASTHAFVVDGYDKNGMFHVNWGWDGRFNGYYSIDALAPQDGVDYWLNQCAVIGIAPTSEKESPSPVWLSEYGLSIDVTDVKKNEPFNTATLELDFVKVCNFSKGEIALCLVNENDDIIEVVKSIPVDQNSLMMFFTLVRFTDCIVTSDIKPSYKLKLFSKEENENNWKQIHGAAECRPYISVINNKLEFTPVTWNVPDNVVLDCPYKEYEKAAYWVREYVCSLYYPVDHIINIIINGQVMQPSNFKSAYCPYPRIRYYFHNGIRMWIEFNDQYRDPINFEVIATPLSEMKSVSVINPRAGFINEVLSLYENLKVSELTIEGQINVTDIEYLAANYPNIKKLTINQCTWYDESSNKSSTLPRSLFNMWMNLEEISIPDNISSIQNGCFYSCEKLSTIFLPEKLNEVSSEAFTYCYYLHHIVCNSANVPKGLIEAIRSSHTSGDEYWYDPIYGGGFATIYTDENLVDVYKSAAQGYKSISVVSDHVNNLISVNDKYIIDYVNFGNNIYVTSKNAIDCTTDNGISAYTHSLIGKYEIPSEINGHPVNIIMARAFNEHKSLTDIVLPAELEQIGEDAFSFTGISDVTLPSKTQTIGRYAFYSCDKLKRITVEFDTPCSLDETAFSDYSIELIVPKGSLEKFRNAPVWSNFYNIREYGESEISTVVNNISSQNSIYNLQGICIKQNATQEDIDNLKHGIYIIGSQKISITK